MILTCETEETSIISDLIQNGKYRNEYLFTTCRKFKGLEADCVILIDVDAKTLNPEDVMMYYVGTSRARTGLCVITTLDEKACSDLLVSRFDYPSDKTIRNPQGKLADKLNALKMKIT